jgi:hypothetical protein
LPAAVGHGSRRERRPRPAAPWRLFLLRALGCLLLLFRALGSAGKRASICPPPSAPCLASTSGSDRPARGRSELSVPVLCLARCALRMRVRVHALILSARSLVFIHSFVDAVMQRAFFMIVANVGSVISILLRREIAIVASPPSWSGSLPRGTFVAHRIIPVGLGGVA